MKKLMMLAAGVWCLAVGAAFAAQGPLLVPDYNRDGEISGKDCDEAPVVQLAGDKGKGYVELSREFLREGRGIIIVESA